MLFDFDLITSENNLEILCRHSNIRYLFINGLRNKYKEYPRTYLICPRFILITLILQALTWILKYNFELRQFQMNMMANHWLPNLFEQYDCNVVMRCCNDYWITKHDHISALFTISIFNAKLLIDAYYHFVIIGTI